MLPRCKQGVVTGAHPHFWQYVLRKDSFQPSRMAASLILVSLTHQDPDPSHSVYVWTHLPKHTHPCSGFERASVEQTWFRSQETTLQCRQYYQPCRLEERAEGLTTARNLHLYVLHLCIYLCNASISYLMLCQLRLKIACRPFLHAVDARCILAWLRHL